jgi:ribosomal protein S10
MSAPPIKPKTVDAGIEEAPIRRIRITLTSRKLEALERVCAELKNKAVGKNVKGNLI